MQSLKDSGYTIAIVQYGREKTTSTLLPFPKYKEMGYETFTKQFKARVIRLLKQRNAFEARETSAKSLNNRKIPTLGQSKKSTKT